MDFLLMVKKQQQSVVEELLVIDWLTSVLIHLCCFDYGNRLHHSGNVEHYEQWVTLQGIAKAVELPHLA